MVDIPTRARIASQLETRRLRDEFRARSCACRLYYLDKNEGLFVVLKTGSNDSSAALSELRKNMIASVEYSLRKSHGLKRID